MTMPPDTRNAEIKRMEDAITAVKQDSGQKYEQLVDILKGQSLKLDQTIENQGTHINDIRHMMGTMAQQIEFTLSKLSQAPGSSSYNTERPVPSPEGAEFRDKGPREDRMSTYKVHRPKHFFPTFNGEDVHKWLFKCTQYFEIEEVADSDKLQIASYYLDGVALYWHQNFLKSLGNQKSLWEDYVEAICYRFGGQQDPLEELMELKQRGELEEYIQDFDILWNKAEVSEKQALVIFLGGLETKIKNTVKMFEPKTLRHAYNLSRLQSNTQTYRKSPSYVRRPASVFQHHLVQTTTTYPPQATTNTTNPQIAPQKTTPTPWTNNPGSSYTKAYTKPTKSIRNQDFEDRRLKGLCFWCDDKFVPGHRCKNKRVYSLNVVEEEEGVMEEELIEDRVNDRELTPHISLDALEGTVGLNTMKVNGKIDKTTVCILIDSGSTHNFLNTTLALKLQFQLTAIKPMIVQAANGEKMVCKSMCRDSGGRCRE
jgi:hypothetical protein